jgi:hypothetical protein
VGDDAVNFPELLTLTAIVLAAPHMNKHLAVLMSLLFGVWAWVLILAEKGLFA